MRHGNNRNNGSQGKKLKKLSKVLKGYKKKIDNKSKYFGVTDVNKKTIQINKSLSKKELVSGAKNKHHYPGVLDTEVHELNHALHPKMTEKTDYKITPKKIKKMTRKQKQRVYNKFK